MSETKNTGTAPKVVDDFGVAHQLHFHEAIRIGEPILSEEVEARIADNQAMAAEIGRLKAELDSLRATIQPRPGITPPASPEEEKKQARFMAELGTSVWRLRQRMVEPGTEKPKEQFRREYRHLESVWDQLRQAGLEIEDHLNKPFDIGQAIKVIDRIPTAGAMRERVQETIRPTIHYKGKHIQMAEVLLETPENQ